MAKLDEVQYLLGGIVMQSVGRANPGFPVKKEFGAYRDHLFSLDERLRAQVDQLAREVARTRGSPSVDPRGGYLLVLRVFCALDVIGFVTETKLDGASAIVEVGWDEARLMEWLLVSVWQRRADHWLTLAALSAARDEGFYSGVPGSAGF